MKVLDLFSGIGGFALGLEAAGFETAAFCEIDPYAQKVLKKNWPGVPIYDDVRRITADRLVSDGVGVDVITGGFPCQDISTAGTKSGLDGDRSGLWSECSRLLGEVRPRYAIFENVTNLLTGDGGDWFKRVLWDISTAGYDAEWHCIPASAIGAHHHRDRVWILAYPNELGLEKHGYGESNEPFINCETIPNPSSKGLQGGQEARNDGKDRQEPRNQLITGLGGVQGGVWEAEPNVGRVANGVPARSHRLRCLGNAVVPQIPELIGRQIMEAERGGS